jgi:transglutaminase-like putative cysteine protease
MSGDRSPAGLAAYQYAFDSPCVRNSPELADFALPSFTPGRPILAAAADLTRRIHTEFRYDPTATSVNTPPSEVLKTRRGVCQDFAHLAIGCLRSLGLPARYVSGYLLTTPPPGKPRLVGADASHAWFSVYTPDCDWVDYDPTNNIRPSDQHVTLAWGRDYSDVCPIKGVFFGGGQQVVQVSVDVTPLEGASP